MTITLLVSLPCTNLMLHSSFKVNRTVKCNSYAFTDTSNFTNLRQQPYLTVQPIYLNPELQSMYMVMLGHQGKVSFIAIATDMERALGSILYTCGTSCFVSQAESLLQRTVALSKLFDPLSCTMYYCVSELRVTVLVL